MVYAIILILGLVILLVIVSRRHPYPIASLSGWAKWLFYIALVLIGIYTAFWMIFGIGEMAGGDLSGASHLLPAAALALMIWAAWRRPFETGVCLIVLSLLASGFFVVTSRGGWNNTVQAVVLGGLPFLLPGVLLLLAVGRNIHEK